MKIEVLAEISLNFEGGKHRCHSKLDHRSGSYENFKAGLAPVQDTSPRSRPCIIQCSKDTSVRRSDEEGIESGARDQLSQSIGGPVRQPVRLIETSHQSPARTLDSSSSSSPQLLLSRTLSVKAYTIRPASQVSPKTQRPATKSTQHFPRLAKALDERKKATPSRKALAEPLASPFLRHWRASKDTSPLKSRPSLPIIVSTTVAASTRRAHRKGSSSLSMTTRRRSTRASMFNTFQDGSMDTPSHDFRAAPSKAKCSPVRDRGHFFEDISRFSSAASAKSKCPEATMASSSESRKWADWKTPAAWELRRVAQALRVRSFSGRKESESSMTKSKTGVLKEENSKPKFTKFKRHSLANLEGAESAEHSSHAPRRESTFFVRATLWKLSKEERQRCAATTGRQFDAFSSTGLTDKTGTTAPRLHSTKIRSERILPSRKSHGALNTRPIWDFPSPETDADHTFSQPARGVLQPTAIITAGQKTPPQNRVSRHSSPFRGKLGGGSWEKSGALPVLSPAPAHAQKTVARQQAPVPSLTWGRRAAAVAMDLGRTLKLKARKASSSSSSLRVSLGNSTGIGGGGGETVRGWRDGERGGGTVRGRGVTRYHGE